VGNTAHGLTTGVGSDVNSIGYYGSNGSGQGQILYNNVAQISNTALNANAGDLWAVEVDLTNGLFWAQDVTTGSKWNGSASANPGTGVGGVSFATSTAGCTAPCSWFVDAQLVGIVGRTVTVNFGASTFTAQCSTGFIPWNGTTACPAAPPPNQSGPGTVTAVSLLPSNVPVASSSNTWHTTARPWTAAAVANSTYLTRLNNLVTWYASRANSGTGCIGSSGLDPYTGTSNAGTAFNGSLELSFGAQFKGNNLTYATNGLATAVMNCSTASYHAHTSAQDFNIGPLNLAWQLYNTYGGASFSASQKSTWLDTNHLNAWYGVGNNTNNWGMYDMWGAWLAIQNGLSTFTGGSVGGTAGIDCMWTGATCSFNTFTMHQANQFNNPPFDLYMDQNGVTPDGLWVERQATTLNAMISEGYNGAQAGAIRTATSTAALSGMYMQAQDGESASGGRQDHHNWVEHARILTDEIMAQQVGASDSFRAGQFEHAAQMDFKVTGNWLNPACCNGATFFATKAHYNPNTACCQQYAPASGGDYGYGLQLMYLLAAAYTNKTASAITEQPMPSEIGGYAFATNSDFGPQVVMAAGGTGLQAAMAGSTANTTFDNPTLWTAVGIEKIGRVGWDARIGPADTGYPSLGGQVSFGPTWNNGSWTRLAQNPASCHGTFTTTFANPAVTFGKIVWNCGTPTFTQNLTLTPDGVLSQTTCTGCSGLWGMTFPIMTSDGDSGSWGTTTMTTNINAAGGFASTTYGPTGDTQNYITLSSNATTMTSEANVNAQGGNITPVRTYTGSPDATQTTFVYPQKSGEPTAAAVRSGMTIPAGTTNQYSNTALNSSVTSGNNGTYYIGPLAAGGWANSITIGSSTINFTSGGTATPCYFIMNLSGGNVTSIEVDRTITASIPNGAHGNYTGANTLSLTAYNPRTNL
jgi:hypothetical protein